MLFHKISFKPYYRWITFNTKNSMYINFYHDFEVLNLIIDGLPSIQKKLLKSIDIIV